MDRPQTHYAQAADGSDVAYQVLGSGPDLVFVSGMSNVDTRWDVPPFARMLERFASFSRLILFDRRGTGVSGPVRIEELGTWEQWADDLRLVLDAAKSKRTAILAEFEAGRWGIMFAATHPDRTSHLMLWNSFARSMRADDFPMGMPEESVEGVVQYLADTWGTPESVAAVNPALAQDEEAARIFARYQRTCISPSAYAEQSRYQFDIDVRHVLPIVTVPTLVMHRREYQLVPVEQGRYLAENIPGARLLEVSGLDSDLATDNGDALDAIEEFVTGVAPAPRVDRALATVLFTDIVDSTRQAVELGDTQWRGVLDTHDEVARREIEVQGGRLVKSTGDGVLATFDGPARGIRCGLALRDRLRVEGIRIRAGLHTGEIEIRGDDIGGIGVHIAARVQSAAADDEVLVSRTVRDLVAGSPVEFTDRGSHSLKGVDEEWRLFAVEAT